MKFKELPIREGINLAGSICSIIAVIMTLSITFNIAQWFIVILGFTFGVCILGLFLSCVKYSIKRYKWLQPVAANPFSLVMIWALSILINLFLALFFGWLFGSACYCLYLLASEALSELPHALRIR